MRIYWSEGEIGEMGRGGDWGGDAKWEKEGSMELI